MPAISPKGKVAIERQVAAGEQARSILDAAHTTCTTCGSGSNIFREREQQIITEMCTWFREPGSTKDDHVALRWIAALAEVRALQDALDERVRKHGEARSALYEGAQTAG